VLNEYCSAWPRWKAGCLRRFAPNYGTCLSTFNLSWGVVYHYFSCIKRPISATLKVSEQSYRLRDNNTSIKIILNLRNETKKFHRLTPFPQRSQRSPDSNPIRGTIVSAISRTTPEQSFPLSIPSDTGSSTANPGASTRGPIRRRKSRVLGGES